MAVIAGVFLYCMLKDLHLLALIINYNTAVPSKAAVERRQKEYL